MIEIEFVPSDEIQRVALDLPEGGGRIALLADITRFNTLAMIRHAGLEKMSPDFGFFNLLSFLFYSEMNTLYVGMNNPESDVYLASKAGLTSSYYAILYGLGELTEERFLSKLGTGDTPGVNSRDDSFRISCTKAFEMALAKLEQNRAGSVFFMTSASDWKENQNVTMLAAAVLQKLSNLILLLCHDSTKDEDRGTDSASIEKLSEKFGALGWYMARCDEHAYSAMRNAFFEFRAVADRPKVLFVNAIQEHTAASRYPLMLDGTAQRLISPYQPALDDNSNQQSHMDLLVRIQARLADDSVEPIRLKLAPPIEVS